MRKDILISRSIRFRFKRCALQLLLLSLSILETFTFAAVEPAPSPVRTHGIRVLYNFGIGKSSIPAFEQSVQNTLALDYIAGLDIYVPWDELEPAPGEFHWEGFDLPLRHAAKAGKSVAIGILIAAHTPDWLKAKVATFSGVHIHPSVGKIVSPVPWDPVYRQHLQRVVREIARRYDGNPLIYYVVINGPSTLFGVETNWPIKRNSVSAADLAKLDFTLAKYRDAWKESIDLFLESWPKTQLSLALHHQLLATPSAEEENVACCRAIRDYALDRYAQKRPGQKIFLQLLGLTGDDRFGPLPLDPAKIKPYLALVWEARDRARLGYESAQVWSLPNVGNKTGYDANYVRQLLERARTYRAEFVKIKWPDLWSNRDRGPYAPYVPVLREARDWY